MVNGQAILFDHGRPTHTKRRQRKTLVYFLVGDKEGQRVWLAINEVWLEVWFEAWFNLTKLNK